MIDFVVCCVFFFKQKTAYEMRISDWSSDVCSSDLLGVLVAGADPSIADPHERLIFSKLVRGIPFCDAGFQNSFDKVRPADLRCRPRDRKRVVEGKSVSVRVVLGGRLSIKTKMKYKIYYIHHRRCLNHARKYT